MKSDHGNTYERKFHHGVNSTIPFQMIRSASSSAGCCVRTDDDKGFTMSSQFMFRHLSRFAFLRILVLAPSTNAWRPVRSLITIALGVLITSLAWGQTTVTGPLPGGVTNTSLSRPLGHDHKLRASLRVGSILQLHQVVLRQAYEQHHAITLFVFDYATGTASRIVLDGSRQKVLREQKLPGRPQSSRKEFQQALEIVRRDRKLGHFITEGAVPEGGFIVDGPPDYPSQDRYIQVRLLSPDRHSLLRLVLVDLTLGVAASDSAWYE